MGTNQETTLRDELAMRAMDIAFQESWPVGPRRRWGEELGEYELQHAEDTAKYAYMMADAFLKVRQPNEHQ